MLPNTFRQLEYLQSTGTQYINTGFVASSNLVRFIADYIPTEVNNLYYTYRVSGGYDGTNRTLGLYGASSDGRVSAGGQDVQIGASFVANTRYLVNMVTNNGTIQGEVNGVTITPRSYSGTSVQPYPYMFSHSTK